MKYSVGMLGGSFDPLHLGHVSCILQAAAQCEELYLVLSFSRKRDFVPMEYRYRWLVSITRHLGNVKVILLEDDALTKEEYDTVDYWERGANSVKEQIGKKIDVVFCGSDYRREDNPYAGQYPEAAIEYFDRSELAISSTEIRKNVFQYWDMLPQVVRPYFVKKVLLVGGESTGKSTLTQNLALYYNTNFVRETGRELCEEAGCEDTMVAEDLHKCLLYQKVEEYERIKESKKLLFIDTDALTTKFFIRFLLKEGEEKKKAERLADAIAEINKYDLVLFLEPTVAFVQDGTRNVKMAAAREECSRQIKDLLDKAEVDYTCLSGDYKDRFRESCRIIKEKFGV